MANTKKQVYCTCKGEGGCYVVNVVEGYVAEKQVCGETMRFGVRRDGKSWTVDELSTGMIVNPGHTFAKKAEALEYIDGEDAQTKKSLVAVMEDFLTRHYSDYMAQVAAFEELKARKVPWSKSERSAFIAGKLKEYEGAKEKELPMVQGWVVYGTTADGKVGWLSYSDHKTDKGAREWLARTAAESDGVRLKSVKASFVSGSAEREAEMAGAAETLRKLCDEVVTWTGSRKRKSGLKSTWKRETPKAPEPVKPAAPKGDAPKPPKPPRKKADELARAMAEIEKLREELAAAKAARGFVGHEGFELVAEAVSVDEMQERLLKFAEGKEGLRVERANAKSAVWLCGDSRPWKDELDGKGLRFGTSSKFGKGWYYSEREQRALAEKLGRA